MIARVRIAPVEHWCGRPTRVPKELAGTTVEIFTDRIATDEDFDNPEDRCGGKNWLLPLETAERIAGEPLPDFIKYWICEHMLEMD